MAIIEQRTTGHRRSTSLCSLRSTGNGPELRIEVAGELDLYGSHPLQSLLAQLCDRDAPALVVDLRRVTFCDGQGLRVLLDAADEARRRGGYLVVQRPGRLLRRLVTLLGLQDRLDLGYDALG